MMAAILQEQSTHAHISLKVQKIGVPMSCFVQMEERTVTLLLPSNLKVPPLITLIKVQRCFKNRTVK